ncbi:ABC transporter permease [Actinokineospora enzanensis]|uniref:ABC transporter permease n=1 Tax=Actinokineospora enzanensis TaxID=155975 RepID=UPI000375A76E|nr:ABC transporter permease [Actinokineospora enzanensis]
MSTLRAQLRIIPAAARIGLAEYRAHYTVRSWLGGWALRLTFQVVFFTSVGLVVGNADTVRYLAVGNVVAVMTMESVGAMAFVAGERRGGKLPLLMAAPGSHLVALAARSLNAPVGGLLSSTVVFLVVAPVFDIPLPGARTLLLIPLVLICALTTYCYGLLFSALVMRFPTLAWPALNVSYLTIMAFAGVNVPVSYWPRPVATLADGLPVTHGLAAVRALLSGGDWAGIVGAAGAELLVGVGWLAVAGLAMHLLLENARRTGGLDR